ncbi:MAG TPA: DNA alkylation repair protein [Vicinamibacterales bacterium]|nr:DNA alkylation repair protein [Vicinamibacterales bacterium]
MKTLSKTEVSTQVKEVLAWLDRRGSKKNRDGMARYGIVARNVAGVSVGDLRKIGKDLGRNHELALALWDTDCYEARMLVAFVGDPEKLTPAQMDRWCRDFDNWAICDALCFHLYDRTPHAYKKVAQWAKSKEEFVKRASFALAASLAGHDKAAPDAKFEPILPLIERAATDDRNFVKKGVSWALRGIGMRSPGLHAKSLALARRLAASDSSAARWIGKDAIRDITRPLVLKRVVQRSKGPEGP